MLTICANTRRNWSRSPRIGGKWLELLKEITPRVTRAAVLRDAALAVGTGQFGAIQSVAPSFGVELTPVGVRDAEEIERGITAFAQGANGGLIVTGSPAAMVLRELIVSLAARHQLPAVYFGRYFVTGGGLISYAPDYIDLFRRPASYVDRILKGEKPSELPVQNPTKYELVINLKTARTLGDAAGALDRGVWRWRRSGRRAIDRSIAVGATRAIVRHREPQWRSQQYCHRGGRAGIPGWLHAAAD
jgi:ABC transporter substrate binding protein